MATRLFVKNLLRRGKAEGDWIRSRRARADLAVFHEFHAPPYGGGNQFLLALVGEFERRRVRIETNRLSGGTPACVLRDVRTHTSFRSLPRVKGQTWPF